MNKRKLLLFFLLVSAYHLPVASAQYVLAPVARQQFFTNNGTVAAGYKLCSFLAGTTTPQSLFSDSTGTVLPNPATLNAAGRPQTGSGSETGIYLDTTKTYKFNLYASGTGNTCNGSPVGALVWSQDNIAASLTQASINTNGIIVPAGLATPGIFYGTGGLKNVTFLAADATSGILQMQPVCNQCTSALHAQVTSGTVPSTVNNTIAEFVVTRTQDQAFGGNYSRFSMTSINAATSPPQGFDGIHIEAGGTETSASGNTLLKRPFIFSAGIENPVSTFTSWEMMRFLSDTDTGNVGFGVSTVGTTNRNVVQIYAPQLSAAGTSDSHSLEFFGYSFDTAQHAVNWRQNVHPTSNGGVSTWRLQNRIDSTSFLDKLSVTDGGVVSISGTTNGSAVKIAASSGGLSTINTDQFGTGPSNDLYISADLSRASSNLFLASGSGKVRITSNFSTPAAPANNVLQVAPASTGNAETVFDAFAGVPIVDFRRANTSAGAPSALQTSDAIMSIAGIGYGSTGYSTARAAIAYLANQNWTDAAQGAAIIISTTSNGTTTLANRMTIVDGVFLGAGSDPGQGGLNVTGALVLTGLTSSSAGDYLCFSTSNSKVIQGTAPCTSSSERFKHDITYNATPGLDLVRQMRPIRFTRNDHPEIGEQYGFKAEDVWPLDSRLVNVDREGKPEGFLYMNYTAILTKAIQELNTRLQQLEERLK